MKEEMELRHPLWIRIFHWINMIAITFLIITGLQIHNPRIAIFSTMDSCRFIHFLFAYVLLFGVIGRVYYAIVTKDYKNVWVSPVKDTKNLPSMLKYYLFLADSHPDYGKYNPGQKMMYSLWLIMALLQIITGFVLYNQNAFMWLSGVLGGAMVVRIIHYVVTWLFILTVLVHVYLDLSEGIPVLKSMFTGKIPKGFHHTSDSEENA